MYFSSLGKRSIYIFSKHNQIYQIFPIESFLNSWKVKLPVKYFIRIYFQLRSEIQRHGNDLALNFVIWVGRSHTSLFVKG